MNKHVYMVSQTIPQPGRDLQFILENKLQKHYPTDTLTNNLYKNRRLVQKQDTIRGI